VLTRWKAQRLDQPLPRPINTDTHKSECAERTLMVTLTDDQVAQALPKIEKPLRTYLWLQDRAATLINPEGEEEFCRKFSGFYRVRARDAGWRSAYFGLMRELRGQPLHFKTCLTRLQSVTGRIEASFASKLLATLDPNLPVIDKIVLGHLGLRLPSWGASDRIEKATNVYQALTETLAEYVGSSSGKRAIAAFRATYGGAQVTDVKIVDLILWQTR
jgi:hypothetical protein